MSSLEKQSMMVRMTVLPDDGGIPVTKSKAMQDHGHVGMGNGCRRPEAGELDVLFRAHTGQAATYSRTS